MSAELALEAVIALSANWVYGHQGTLPWRLRDDLARFKRLTVGQAVVMGRRTCVSLPGERPLPGRLNLVLSRSAAPGLPAGFVPARSLNQAKRIAAAAGHYKLMLIGGAAVWEAGWPELRAVYLTRIPLVLDGDCRIGRQSPLRQLECWDHVLVDHYTANERNQYSFSLWRLTRSQ